MISRKTYYRDYLQACEVPLKKYFHGLRPLLSVRGLEKFGTPAPVERKLGVTHRKPAGHYRSERKHETAFASGCIVVG
ncbi:DNA polymerase beta superfamily protein [Pseudomonas sp. SMV71]|uniref:DNA polymerase beta superfamily protein n=1 Tax=Pseudomonas sp. SMV71 TaxID=3390195 RepID=UPI003F864A18